VFQRILYSSRASQDISIKDVYNIIRASHNRNSHAGLTGGLLFLDGYFFQVLEGAPYAVAERYKKIMADPRHHEIMLRQNETTDELLFPNEWMALRSGLELEPDLLKNHHYEIGLPADSFDGPTTLSFLLACFNQPVFSAATPPEHLAQLENITYSSE